MTCGCTPQPVSLTHDGRAIRADWQTHAAMCSVCMRCERWQVNVTTGVCPRGLAPNRDGHVTWLGMVWRGVPYPIRLLLAFRLRRVSLLRALPGCGCLNRVKAYYETFLSSARNLTR